jgi:hypothetical protein
MSYVESDRDRDRRIVWRLWLLVTCVYALTARGNLTGDPNDRLLVAEAICTRGSISFDQSQRPNSFLKRNGKFYSVFAPGQTVVFLPVTALSAILGKVTGGRFSPNDIANLLSSVIVMPAIAAATVAAFFRMVRLLKLPTRAAVLASLVVAFGSPLWVYASTGSEEPALACFALWSIVWLLEARCLLSLRVPDGHPSEATARAFVDHLGRTSVCLAFGFAYRVTFVSLFIGVAILMLTVAIQGARYIRSHPSRTLLWLILSLVVLGMVPAYNYARFGNPLNDGYAEYWEVYGGLFANPFLTGLLGTLFSPGFSVFLYTPILIASLFALFDPATRKQLGVIGYGILAATAIHLIIYSKHTLWSGSGWLWGTRYHVSIIPLLLLPAALFATHASRPFRRALIAIAILSVGVQIAGWSLNTGLERYQRPQDWDSRFGMFPQAAAWNPSASPLFLRFKNLALKLSGQPLLSESQLADQKVMNEWRIFPIRGYVAAQKPVVAIILWSTFSVIFLVTWWAARSLVKSLPESEP